jgi:mannose-6-phosphate isomerase-like protein (cupin superfamily)
MSAYSIKRIDDMEAIYWGSFKRARAELGLNSFGLQVMDLPPNSEGYPEHDHGHDGQEELYVVLRGGGEIELDGERHPLDPDTMAGVQASVRRKVIAGPDGIRLLLAGGVPGKPYEAPEMSVLGNPDPVAGQAPPS